MTTLAQSEVVFDNASTVDPFGRVFYHEGGVYRAISSESAGLCKEILERSARWEEHGLVRTKEAPFTVEGYPMAVSHEKVAFKSYCVEWLPAMLKDAAMGFLRLNRALVNDGYVCKDAHPWNIFFDFSRPVYIDIGSIVPFSRAALEQSMREFVIYFLLPLVLFEKKGYESAYEFLKKPIPNAELRNTLAKEVIGDAFIGKLDFENTDALFDFLLAATTGVNVDGPAKTEWSDYDQKEVPIQEPVRFHQKQRAAYDFLLTQGPGTVLDVGCNNGWFSRLLERMGHSVVAIDTDVPSITRLYDTAKKDALRVLTLRMDFSDPTPAHGLGSAYPSFEERFSVDIVLAMAVVHHLAYKQKMTFDAMARRAGRLAKKSLIIEFIPKDDFHVAQWDQSGMEWYARDIFISSFLKVFKDYRVVKSSPNPREVFIFTK